MTYAMLNKFGFKDIDVTISTKPENAMGSDEYMGKGNQCLKNALRSIKIHYTFLKVKAHFMAKN